MEKSSADKKEDYSANQESVHEALLTSAAIETEVGSSAIDPDGATTKHVGGFFVVGEFFNASFNALAVSIAFRNWKSFVCHLFRQFVGVCEFFAVSRGTFALR